MTSSSLALRGAGAKKDDKDLVDRAAKSGQAVNFARPRGAGLPRAIQSMASERGKKIDSEAVRALMDLAGDEMLGLEQELEKVMLFVGDKPLIGRDDVLEAVADVKEGNVFEFTDAIGARDTAGALLCLRRMIEQGQEPLMILGMVLRHFRIIWKIHKRLEDGQTPGVIAKGLRLNEWILKKNYLPQTKKFPPEALGGITSLLAELDLKMKSTRSDKDVLFERAVINLCLGRSG